MEHRWLEWAQRLQAIAQAGLTYSKDVYDIERFEEIRQISFQILSEHTRTEMNIIETFFAGETGYPTPKVDIRGVVFNEDNKLLLVKEKQDGAWALPGGWADVGLSPREVVVKEVKEESGYDVRPLRLLAVLDRNKHPHPPHPNHIYKMFIQCEIIGGNASVGLETSDVGFFAEDQLPPLSLGRNTESQIRMVFEYHSNPAKEVALD